MTTNLGAPPLSAVPDSTADSPEAESRGRLPQLPPWLLRWVVPVLALVFGAIALTVLRAELRHYRYHDIVRSIASLPAHAVLKALGLTALGYLTLALYDLLALRYVGKPIPPWRVALTSFIAYAFVQTLGFALLTGGAIRFRFWSMWGLTPAEIVQGISFSAVTFWLGVLTVAGTVFLFTPDAPAFAAWGPAVPVRAIGALLLAVVAGYLLWCAFYRRPFTIRGTELKAPSIAIAGLQLVVSTFDWTIAGAVLWTLTSHFAPLPFPAFLGLFVTAQIAGQASHVPGGLGVFDALMLVGLRGHLPVPEVLSALLAYRAIYYLIPFLIAVLMLAAHEARQRRAAIKVGALAAGKWVTWLVPVLLPASTFIAGAILLFSGATPGIHERLTTLGTTVPLQLIEFSHFAASLTGAVLLVLAWGLHRRLDGAWVLAVVALGLGIVASLLKGLDWEEALLLSVVLAALLPARRHFYRKATLLSESLTPGWLIALVLVVGGAVWLGLFSYQHVEYDTDLWWQFALHGDAPRFLRATVGVLGLFLVGGVARLLWPTPPEPNLPNLDEIALAAAVARDATDTNGNLALLGDKALLFSESRRAFLMYAVEKRSWVTLGDPVGPPEEHAELAWRFREMADRHGGWTVFYEVGADSLPLYVDLGLSLLKLGEQARVPLTTFSLEGGARRGLRYTRRAMEKEGVTFELVPAEKVPGLLPELRVVSDAWLGIKHTREKGFSMGRFDERYLSYFPVGLARQHGRIVAFANIWVGGGLEELSVDLMRHLPDAPRGVMEYLFIELMLWGSARGFRWFDLGMAPLAGLETRTLAPLWHKAGGVLFRYGEHFYNFQGLRDYKEKFDPVWEPRYLASPGGLVLPRLLANVAALISGGLKGVVAK